MKRLFQKVVYPRIVMEKVAATNINKEQVKALFSLADFIKKEGNIEELARICAEALMANDIHQSAFNELYEKYQIREKRFSEILRERDHAYQTKLLENKNIYEEQIRSVVSQRFSEERELFRL